MTKKWEDKTDQEVEPVRKTPPGFPYPGERIVYSSARNAPNFTPGEDSWFCISKLDNKRVDLFGDRKHHNPYRLIIHSPLRGSVSFYIQSADAQILIQALLSLMADDNTYRDDDENEVTISKSYIEDLISDDYSINWKE